MTKVVISLAETTLSVNRPVVYDVVKQLQEITKITKEARIFFPGEMKSVSQNGSTIDDQGRDSILGNSRYLFIEVEEDYDKEAVTSTATTQIEHIPVFADDDTGTYIVPIYGTYNVKININYRTQSEVEATRWYDDMRTRISMMRDINLHNVSYYYEMPEVYLELIKDVYTLREDINPYGQTLSEYVVSNATPRLGFIADVSGLHPKLVVSETQSRIVGMFDFDTIPDKPQKDASTGNWDINFTYKFSYEKPMACEAIYPVMVHNQLLPEKYLDHNGMVESVDNHFNKFSKSFKALNMFESQLMVERNTGTEKPITIPPFDDFQTTMGYPGMGDIWTALCSLDLTDYVSLVNLRELGDVVIDDDILDFIINSEYPYINNPYQSILNISVFKNKAPIDYRSFSCDSKLNIKANSNLNPRNLHRVRFNIVTDLTRLSQAAIDRLLKYPKALVKIISAINQILANHPGMASLGNKRFITSNDFATIYRFITGYNYNNSKNTKNYAIDDTYNRPKYGNDPSRSNGVLVTNGTTTITNQNTEAVKYHDEVLARFGDMTGDTQAGIYHPLDPLRDIRGATLTEIKRNQVRFNTVMRSCIVAVNYRDNALRETY